MFDLSVNSGYTVVTCPYEMTAAAGKDLEGLVQQWIKNPVKCYVFDFKDVTVISPVVFKSFVLLQRVLKGTQGTLISVGVSKEVLRQLASAGMETIFNVKTSLSQGLAQAGIQVKADKAATLDVNFINPFLGSTRNAIEMQASCKVELGKPRLKKSGEVLNADIAGVISLTSSAFTGSIALCFPAQTFLGIYGAMLGETPTEITEESQDAAGELLNIIFGQAKAVLNDTKGYSIQKAIPTVVRGQALQVHHMSREVAVILPFTCDYGAFHIEISINPS